MVRSMIVPAAPLASASAGDDRDRAAPDGEAGRGAVVPVVALRDLVQGVSGRAHGVGAVGQPARAEVDPLVDQAGSVGVTPADRHPLIGAAAARELRAVRSAHP